MESAFVNWLEVGLLVGLLYAPVTIGLAWAFRVLNYPDLTCEGSFIFSGAVSISVLNTTGSIVTAVLCGVAAGAGAGILTGVVHIVFNVSRLLSGIVVWAILYSGTIRVMGGLSNLRAHSPTLFESLNPLNTARMELIIASAVAGVAIVSVGIFSLTRWGRLSRAAGDQVWMVASCGVSPHWILLGGLALANGLVGLAGTILCQNRGVCDVNMGSGLLVSGLAAMVLGEAVYGAKKVWQHIVVVVAGSTLYNLAVSAFYFDWGFGLTQWFLPSDVRLVSGLLILLPAALVARMAGRYRLFASEW